MGNISSSSEDESKKMGHPKRASMDRRGSKIVSDIGGGLELSPVQILQVQKIWEAQLAKGPCHAGEVIFSKIVKRSREAQKIFGIQGINDLLWGNKKCDTSSDERFKYHVEQFTQSMDNVIKNLHTFKKVPRFLEGIGKKHVDFRSRGFNPRLWDLFAEAMTDTTREWSKNKRDDETQEAWTKIVFFSIERLKRGYYRELRRNSLSYAAAASASKDAQQQETEDT